MELPQAIDVLVKELRNDPEYFKGWQANIAVSFQDEINKSGYIIPNEDLHTISNNAAKNFLNLLTYITQ